MTWPNTELWHFIEVIATCLITYWGVEKGKERYAKRSSRDQLSVLLDAMEIVQKENKFLKRTVEKLTRQVKVLETKLRQVEYKVETNG